MISKAVKKDKEQVYLFALLELKKRKFRDQEEGKEIEVYTDATWIRWVSIHLYATLNTVPSFKGFFSSLASFNWSFGSKLNSNNKEKFFKHLSIFIIFEI